MEKKPVITGERRRARILALQVLYEIDSVAHEAEAALEHRLSGERMLEEGANFARELVSGVIAEKAAIDENIHRFAPAWPVAQINTVDRNILRLAIFEILFAKKVPVKVAINEAVELAKRFGGDNSPRFVNGVLGSVSGLLAGAGDS
jgi:N utilization substance protein B